MTDLSDLIERVRKAEGPDRELDCYLEALSDGRTIRESIHPQYGRQLLARNSRPPHDEYWIDHPDNGTKPYTGSLDAITALIEKELPGCAYGFDNGPKTHLAFVDRHDHAVRFLGARWTAEAATIPLALCLAFLLSLQEISK
jgi:hypothetical protein